MQHQGRPTNGPESFQTGIIHILVVTGNRMTRPATVTPNLMGSPGYRRRLNKTIPLKPLQTGKQSQGTLALIADPNPALAIGHLKAQQWLGNAVNVSRPAADHQG